jgi:murein DD-endopeptidase MepM/ murein hydrolase activator NlpD
MRALPWILGGGAAALALYYASRRKRDAKEVTADQASPRPEPLPGRWVWPVGIWRGRKPEISSGFGTPRRTPAGDLITHRGVDIMYRRQPGDPWRAGTPHATTNYVMPDGRAALAASDGVVTFAAKTPRGWSVILDHAPRNLTTYYTHLSSLAVATKQVLAAGTPIGIIGGDPLDARKLSHLHLEVRRGGGGEQIDPQLLMASWEYLPDPSEPAAALVARNAHPRSARRHEPVPAHSRSRPRPGR